MWHYTPKERSKFCFFISLLFAIFIYCFTDSNIIYKIDSLIFSFVLFISYLLCKKTDIRFADVITALIIFGGIAIIKIFNNSDLAFNIGIKDLENDIKPFVITTCKTNCSIKFGNVITNNNKNIYDINYIHKIDEGIIYSNGNDISYTFSINNKCIKKELNESFRIINSKCEKNENY